MKSQERRKMIESEQVSLAYGNSCILQYFLNVSRIICPCLLLGFKTPLIAKTAIYLFLSLAEFEIDLIVGPVESYKYNLGRLVRLILALIPVVY